MSFEEVKEYFAENREIYYNAMGEGLKADLSLFCKYAIEDLQKKMDGEEVCPKLGSGDIDYAAVATLKLVYLLVADEIDRIDKFADAWSELYSNYLNAFYPSYDKATYITGLVNLLTLKNNMARLITLSNYIIFKKENDSYTNVSTTFIESIINNRKAKEKDDEKEN